MKRAWLVWEKPFTEVQCYVMADSRNAARTRARDLDESGSLGESDWTKIVATRMPELDEGVTDRALVDAGHMWQECLHCGNRLTTRPRYPDEPAEPIWWSESGIAWCSEDCYRSYLATGRTEPKPYRKEDGICLYED